MATTYKNSLLQIKVYAVYQTQPRPTLAPALFRHLRSSLISTPNRSRNFHTSNKPAIRINVNSVTCIYMYLIWYKGIRTALPFRTNTYRPIVNGIYVQQHLSGMNFKHQWLNKQLIIIHFCRTFLPLPAPQQETPEMYQADEERQEFPGSWTSHLRHPMCRQHPYLECSMEASRQNYLDSWRAEWTIFEWVWPQKCFMLLVNGQKSDDQWEFQKPVYYSML